MYLQSRCTGGVRERAGRVARSGASEVAWNPEHSPLVKLWAGSLISLTGFRLREFRLLHDKADERVFAQENVKHYNDPDSVQRRARIAMWTLNGLLLIALGFAVRRVFGAGVAPGAILVLAVDPTVATHLPVVLTDLPVSLLASTAILLATRAFKSWSWADLAPCSMALGLTFGTKHSGIVFYGLLGLAGLVLAVVVAPGKPAYSRVRQTGKVAVVLLGALAILWSLYLFRFTESPDSREVFNSPLADKIADLHSPVQRFLLREMAATHVLPRASNLGTSRHDPRRQFRAACLRNRRLADPTTRAAVVFPVTGDSQWRTMESSSAVLATTKKRPVFGPPSRLNC